MVKERSAMTTWIALALSLVLLGCTTVAAQQAPIPAADELSGHPFAIKDKWVIGGSGNWDYLTLDPVAHQLFIAHQTVVQVVDVDTGAVAGEITGFGEAHAVVLNPDGQFGYATDGRANVVRIFDRRTFQIGSSVDVGCSPRSIAFETQTNLLFAICGATPAFQAPPRRPRSTQGQRPSTPIAEQTPRPATGGSHVIVIDAEARRPLADIAVPGDFRVAQSDDNGQVYVTVGASEQFVNPRTGARMTRPPSIARLDAAAIAAEARKELDAQHRDDSLPVQWQTDANGSNLHVRSLWLDSACANPQGLAIDSHSLRLFVSCGNQALEVLNSETGAVAATLTIGPGADSVAYDANRGLIFTANGGGYGSITVIRQHITDTYAVVQNLPTMQHARTMAIDPSTGEVYLVTTLYGAKLDNPPAYGIGPLKVDAVDGTFQVLVIGN
jgi:DNA-binding beta-propeller fold protein YncE